MRIPVIIPDEHHEKLRLMAFRKRSSISEEVRIAIAEYLERNPTKSIFEQDVYEAMQNSSLTHKNLEKAKKIFEDGDNK